MGITVLHCKSHENPTLSRILPKLAHFPHGENKAGQISSRLHVRELEWNLHLIGQGSRDIASPLLYKVQIALCYQLGIQD